MNTLELDVLKARQKATWESGDFGRVARFNEPGAAEFMQRLPLRPGASFLDVACGTGNLAIIAARMGCRAFGLDLASNLIAQAYQRAASEGVNVEFRQGDAEELPYRDAVFDFTASMFGVMFAPRPDRIVSELLRVTQPGGWIALANWTPEGFIGRMFSVFKAHLPPVPSVVPSPLEWGGESVVRERFANRVREIRCTRRIARLRYPFSPEGTVDFFREYYGPTRNAFDLLEAAEQAALRHDLIKLQTEFNMEVKPGETDTPAEYLEVHVRR